MDHLKEQLKKHYETMQPSEGFLQKLHTLEAPEPAPVPIPMRRKRLLAPIAAMLIAAVALLGGGKYLMDMEPPTAVPPEIAVESAVGFDDICYGAADAPTSVPEYSAAPDAPEMFYSEDPAPEETAPEKTAPQPGSSDETAPQTPTTPESTNPVLPPLYTAPEDDPTPPEDITDPEPPVEGPADDPTTPPDDDVPPHDPGDDDPPTEPDINAPTDEPDKPVDPPSDPVDPPDEPTNPPDDPERPGEDGPAGEPDEPINPGPPPEIYGFYTKSNGQHAVCVINCDTGESKTLILNTTDSPNGYYGYHNAFGYTIEVSVQSASSAPTGPGTAELEQAIPHSSNYKVTVKVIGIA